MFCNYFHSLVVPFGCVCVSLFLPLITQIVLLSIPSNQCTHVRTYLCVYPIKIPFGSNRIVREEWTIISSLPFRFRQSRIDCTRTTRKNCNFYIHQNHFINIFQQQFVYFICHVFHIFFQIFIVSASSQHIFCVWSDDRCHSHHHYGQTSWADSAATIYFFAFNMSAHILDEQ